MFQKFVDATESQNAKLKLVAIELRSLTYLHFLRSFYANQNTKRPSRHSLNILQNRHPPNP